MDQMHSPKRRLMLLEKPIRVAVVGAGSMGRGLAYQLSITPGMQPVAIADVRIKRAIDCARLLRAEYDLVDTVADLNFTIQRGRLAITDNAELIASSNLVHVMVEASNSAYGGARHAINAIQSHQHVVMMNTEADLMYGPVLMRTAIEHGVVYTCADGDKPTAIKKLIDEITLYGFDLVMAGNIKNFHDPYTTPEKIAFEADMRNLDHRMCAYFADGTKMSVEMAVLANAINGRTCVPGMFGQRLSNLHEIFHHYNFGAMWDGKTPIVDYLLGAEPRGGLFVIGHTEDKYLRSTLSWFPPDIGSGPFYLFYKPYYLGHIEAMLGIAEAYLDGTSRLQPAAGMRTNVFTYAKKNLRKGDRLDGRGGFQSYGLIENMSDQKDSPGLPILLSDNLTLTRDVAKDERISLSDVAYDPNDPAFVLYFDAGGVDASVLTGHRSVFRFE